MLVCYDMMWEKQGMTYDGNVVNDGEERPSEACNVEGTSADTPLADDPHGDGRFVAFVDLESDEHRDEDAESDKKTDDLGVVPRVLASSPLQSQENADDGGDENGCAFNVHECELVFPGEV